MKENHQNLPDQDSKVHNDSVENDLHQDDESIGDHPSDTIESDGRYTVRNTRNKNP